MTVLGEIMSQQELIDLLPCPFCGGEAAHGTVTYDSASARKQWWTQETFFSVNCVVCGVNNRGLVGHRTRQEAAVAWNRRYN
jgi:Zn ribbon nucleic-acid-binding protein